VHTGAGGPGPVTLPQSIVSPVQLALARAQVGELVIDGAAALHGVALTDLVLDAQPGAEHRIGHFALEGNGLAVEGGLRLGTAAPLAVSGEATVRPTMDAEHPRWAAVLRASGSVPQLHLQATLRGVPLAGHEAPTLDADFMLHPLQPWVLAALRAQTQALDLSALWAQAPATRLSGQAELKGGEGGTPLAVSVTLDNAQPGRWNERRLPLQRLELQAQGRLDQPDRLDLTRFDLALADAKKSAGHWTGKALWLGHELSLDTRLAGVAPQRLDGRAAAMTLSGPVAATLRGLPSPDFRGPAAQAAPPPPGVRWKVDLEGRFDAAPQAVQLQLEGSADDQRLDLKQARLQAGAARAELTASVARAARGEWRLESMGKVSDFNPQPWWPGTPASPAARGGAGNAWRQGPHRLSGHWQFEVRLPADADRAPPLAVAQRLVGNGSLAIHDSLLAGVPLEAEITLGYAAPAAASLRADLRLGGNQLVVEGRGDPAGSGESDRWRAEFKGDALAALAPLLRLDADLAAWAPQQGSASAVLAGDGRWPNLHVEGSARVSQLQAGRLSLARGTVAGRMDSRGEAPLALQLDLAGLQLGKQRADNLRAELRGTLADHHIDISGALPLVPPAVAEQVLGIQAQSGTRGQMQAQGSWVADPAGGGRWRARIEHLVVGSWDGSAVTGPPASGWAEAQDLRAELRFDGAGQLQAVQADAGRVRLADTVTLRWDAVKIDLQGEQPQVQLRADIDPFLLAPLLARAQPGMGWQGDLRLGAHVDIRAGAQVDADLVFERRDGDLQVASGEGVQLLGLSQFRLALAAHDGVWNFTQAFHGRSLGDITGAVRVQSTPQQRWPRPDDAVSGTLQARVADIGIWSAWVPPGWRLTGEVRTTAQLSGRFAEPQYTGELTGSGLGVRNLLQGVNVNDGDISVKLAGATAQIERFTLKGGEGTVSVTGGATLGLKPQARLVLKADHFKVLGRVDRQLVASGDATLVFDADQGQLDGKLRVDEALFDASRSNAPTLDDDVTVRRPGSADAAAADAAAPRPKRNFALNLEIDLADKVRVIGKGVDTALKGQLRLTTPGGLLAVNGSINTDGGTYKAYGQNLEIERGVIAFSGPYDNPRLDVLALRPNIDTRVGVSITGNLLTLRVRLYSEPDMSDTDKLSWLALGRAPDGLGRNDTALLQRAAVALLAGEGEAPTDALMKSLGIDDISLRQGDTDVRETVISVGKQLSRRWYIGYERGVNATTGTWQLTYRIAQRFTLRLQSGLDNAADVIWTWRLQETPPDAAQRKKSMPAPPP
jgi:translocation and assembly module TamB